METTNTPIFVFVARPVEKVRLAGLFDDGPVRGLLEKPGELRYAGWDMQTLDQARIVKGEYLEVKLAEYKTVQLYEDGMLFAKVSADGNFLGWAGSNDKPFVESPRLNPLALIEFTYSFVSLYSRIIEYLKPPPQKYTLHVSIRRTTFDGKKLYLNPYGVETWARLMNRTRYEAPDDSADFDIEVDSSTLKENVARAAYLFVEKIYLWFGVPTNEIPYTTGSDSSKALDVELIKRGGKQAQ